MTTLHALRGGCTVNQLGFVALSILTLVALSAQASGADDRWQTRVPVTYVLDYGNKHLGYPEWLEATGAAPPMLLHLGKDVPITHNWGPIAALGGENQAWGKGDYTRRLTPEELRERIEGLTAMVAELHKAGVEMVTPYICSMTIAGHHETRAGLWEFWDHLGDYEGFDLGPRPPDDPIEWMQRDADGGLVRFYRYDTPFYPPYEPNHRYAACVNNPNWRTYLQKVAELVARCGYDGSFVDNSGSQRCHCEYCQAKFKDYLAARYSPAEREKHFGSRDVADLSLARGKEDGLLWVETQRFWIRSLYDHQQDVREGAERARKPFLIFPNGGHGRPQHVKLVYRDSDYIMFERSIGDYGTHPGLARVNLVEDIFMRHYNDNIFQHKYTQCLRAHVRPLILTRGGYPRTRPEWDMNANIACLGMAEAAAFSGGGGFLLRPAYDRFGDALNEYRSFFEAHPDLYTGMDSWAQVGVAMFSEQALYGNRAHFQRVKQLTQQLLEEHVLFDYVTEEQFTPEHLARYSVVVLPYVQYAGMRQLRAFEGFVRDGGIGILVGDHPTADLRMEPFERPPLQPATEGAQDAELGVRVRRIGDGICIASERLPVRTGVVLWAASAGATDLPVIVDDEDRRPAVRVNAFVRRDGPRPQVVLHLLNYDVPLGVDAPDPDVVPRLELSVPLPNGLRAERVELFDPAVEGREIVAFETRGERVKLAVEGLRIYKALRIACSRG